MNVESSTSDWQDQRQVLSMDINYLAPLICSSHFQWMLSQIKWSRLFKSTASRLVKVVKSSPVCCTCSCVPLTSPKSPLSSNSTPEGQSKLAFVCQIEFSKDPLITQALSILNSCEFQEIQSIPCKARSLLQVARESILLPSSLELNLRMLPSICSKNLTHRKWMINSSLSVFNVNSEMWLG